MVWSGLSGAPGSNMSQAIRDKLSKITIKKNMLIHYTSRRSVGSPGSSHMWQESMPIGRQTWPICRILPAKQLNEVAAHRNWCILQVCLYGLCPVQRRQINYRSILQSAHHSETSTNPQFSNRQRQGVLQLGLPEINEASQDPALFQWEQSNDRRGKAIQLHYKD